MVARSEGAAFTVRRFLAPAGSCAAGTGFGQLVTWPRAFFEQTPPGAAGGAPAARAIAEPCHPLASNPVDVSAIASASTAPRDARLVAIAALPANVPCA